MQLLYLAKNLTQSEITHKSKKPRSIEQGFVTKYKSRMNTSFIDAYLFEVNSG